MMILSVSRMFAVVILLSSLVGCEAAETQSLPDVVLERVTLEGGSSTLANWTAMDNARPSQRKRLIPDNPAYRDARLFYEFSEDANPESATASILKLNEFENAKLRATHKATTEFVRTIDGHDRSGVTMFMYDGKLQGRPAKAISYTWTGQALCGDEPFCSVAHIFMAPTQQFEALGGGAVIAVAWLQQDVPPGVKSMKKYGALSADEATGKLAQYADSWMAGYIQTHVEMMRAMGSDHNLNQQVLSSMQSYNNALSQCFGLDCSISQGPGNSWSVSID